MPSHPVVILAPTSAAQMVVKFSWVSDGALKMPQSDGERESGRAESVARIMRNLVSHSLEINTQEGRKEGRGAKPPSLLEMRYSEGNQRI